MTIDKEKLAETLGVYVSDNDALNELMEELELEGPTETVKIELWLDIERYPNTYPVDIAKSLAVWAADRLEDAWFDSQEVEDVRSLKSASTSAPVEPEPAKAPAKKARKATKKRARR